MSGHFAMSDSWKKQFHANTLIFKDSLERIIEKYSKLNDSDGIEVDVHNVTMKDYLQCVHESKMELSELELSESSTNSREQSPTVQDIARDTQLFDTSHQDVGAEESGFQSDHSAAEHDAVSGIDSTQLNQSSIDETRESLLETSQPEDHHEEPERTLHSQGSSFMASQPEDHDEELERTLSGQGSSIMEQYYPIVILKIGEAWHRQRVSKAADSVLKRYRRLRDNSVRSSLNRTFEVTSRSTGGNPKKMVVKNSLQNWQAERSPRKMDVKAKRDLNWPVQVMDFSLSGNSSEPEETSFSSSPSQLREQPTPLFFSPLRRRGESLRSVAPASLPVRKAIITSEHLMYEVPETSYSTETVLCSPARQSPFKTRLTDWEGQGGSPRLFAGSPNAGSVERYPRDDEASRSVSASFSLQKSIMSPRKCRPKEEMDFSLSRISPEPEETSFSSSSQLREPTPLFFSPPRFCTAPTRPSLRSVAPASLPLRRAIITSEHPVYEVTESPAVLCSPARQSPFKTRLTGWEGQDGSLRVLSRSPKAGSMERRPRDDEESRSVSASFSLQKSMSPQKHRSKESYSPSRLKLSYYQSSTTIHRHSSFDNSFHSRNMSHSMKIDAKFQKYYHRFVCQGKSAPSNAPPCRLCTRNSETSRGHNSSALEALALSPHHSVQRKRNRELDNDWSPKSKRSRDWDCTYSPGSVRYRRDILRHQHHHTSRTLFLSKENETPPYLIHSPGKAAVSQAFSIWPHQKHQ